MNQKIIHFLKENKELFQRPIDKIDWEEVYELALDKFRGELGSFTEFWLNKDIHPEKYLSELPKYFLSRSSIKKFEISNNIISISSRAFYNCTNLTRVVIGNSVRSIGEMAFSGCYGLTSVIIGNSTASIGDYAFEYCTSLKSIIIPESITSIGDWAFSECGDNLVIKYRGTIEQFELLTKDVFDETYFTCHCIDGDIVKKKR